MTTPSPEALALKPCPNPWCDKPGSARSRKFVDFTYRVFCECSFMGPERDTEAEAIAAWNTRPTPSGEVVQADRDAAGVMAERIYGLRISQKIRDGELDEHHLVQSMKHHRLASSALDEKAIRYDERKRIIAGGCIHTTKAQSRPDERPDIQAWQEAQSEWFDATICEIVSEYAEWRDGLTSSGAGEPVAWLYTDLEGGKYYWTARQKTPRDDWGWTETPLYALATPPHLPPAELPDNRVEGEDVTKLRELRFFRDIDDGQRGMIFGIVGIEDAVRAEANNHHRQRLLLRHLVKQGRGPEISAAITAFEFDKLRAIGRQVMDEIDAEDASLPTPDEGAVERVAKAIYDATHADLLNCYEWDDAWEPYQEAGREMYYKEARAAIQAIPAPATDAGQSADGLVEALTPFAAVAEWDIGENEDDDDLYRVMTGGHNHAPLLKVGDLRRAKEVFDALTSLPKSPSAGDGE